ncbi:MAG: FliI/YscN family ATPase [Candidatus Krumholzibacteria bacterium]|jgi:FliI/YscN family ATPase|nr:FliI/YscN family ATPase [Candidatus Krumholzibacteria bacterium]MDP6796620.1 FliI/YscN family ATPase [Candidatus Krumholzibacteria bacterium]MDP7020954.1 FliI/YscN family ATPase [Candidatus Krumholzibacteria bacterium]
MSSILTEAREALKGIQASVRVGRVTQVVGLLVEAEGTRASIGELCELDGGRATESFPAEVVGFRGESLLLMPYKSMDGIRPGTKVRPTGHSLRIRVGEDLIGRVLDGLGKPLDGGETPWLPDFRKLRSPAPAALERTRIDRPFETGIRAIDSLLTCGEGQRMGIFAGSGVGKSMLLGMLARNADADVIVLALIGERGREVREFVEESLGAEGLNRSVVVAVTSDASALERVKGAESAFSIAEHFRDQGKRVLLMMDSVTRYAMSLREIGLATGEPPASKGYTPSVFAALPKLLERAGTNQHGSITGLFTVLVEGDDLNDPVADSVRSILDGHIVLSRSLANAGHFPAIDVLESVSRLFPRVASREKQAQARELMEAMNLYRENEDLIQIGAYEKGKSPEIDRAITLRPRWQQFLKQKVDERFSLTESDRMLSETLEG